MKNLLKAKFASLILATATCFAIAQIPAIAFDDSIPEPKVQFDNSSFVDIAGEMLIFTFVCCQSILLINLGDVTANDRK
ncbi:MAG TPA: hypothetical protein DCY88_34505 [Cyanobacteria bacterium UBA11372]|nr:hypothetical protein [Cyanobacteria bacterium UBA11372]